MDIGLVECGLGVVPIRRQHQARRCALPSKGLHGLDIRVTEANTSGACDGNAPKGIKKVGLGPSLSTTDIRDIRTKQTEDVPKTEYSWAARESGISYIYFLVYAESCQSFSGKVGWIYRSSSPLFGTSKKSRNEPPSIFTPSHAWDVPLYPLYPCTHHEIEISPITSKCAVWALGMKTLGYTPLYKQEMIVVTASSLAIKITNQRMRLFRNAKISL